MTQQAVERVPGEASHRREFPRAVLHGSGDRQLGGGVHLSPTELEAMRKWIQPFTYLSPIAHFAGLARAVLVRGSGVEVVYVQLCGLGVIASALVGFSAWKFRGQMS